MTTYSYSDFKITKKKDIQRYVLFYWKDIPVITTDYTCKKNLFSDP